MGAADFVLQEGDLIVWYYGQWDVTEGLALLSVSASEAELGDQVTVTVTDYAGHPVVGAWVSFGSQAAATDAQGQAVFMVREAGTLLVSAELTDNAGLPILVRAEKKSVVVEPVPVRVRVEGVSTTLVPERLVTLASTAVPDAIGYDSGAPSVYAALVRFAGPDHTSAMNGIAVQTDCRGDERPVWRLGWLELRRGAGWRALSGRGWSGRFRHNGR